MDWRLRRGALLPRCWKRRATCGAGSPAAVRRRDLAPPWNL